MKPSERRMQAANIARAFQQMANSLVQLAHEVSEHDTSELPKLAVIITLNDKDVMDLRMVAAGDQPHKQVAEHSLDLIERAQNLVSSRLEALAEQEKAAQPKPGLSTTPA